MNARDRTFPSGSDSTGCDGQWQGVDSKGPANGSKEKYN